MKDEEIKESEFQEDNEDGLFVSDDENMSDSDMCVNDDEEYGKTVNADEFVSFDELVDIAANEKERTILNYETRSNEIEFTKNITEDDMKKDSSYVKLKNFLYAYGFKLWKNDVDYWYDCLEFAFYKRGSGFDDTYEVKKWFTENGFNVECCCLRVAGFNRKLIFVVTLRKSSLYFDDKEMIEKTDMKIKDILEDKKPGKKSPSFLRVSDCISFFMIIVALIIFAVCLFDVTGKKAGKKDYGEIESILRSSEKFDYEKPLYEYELEEDYGDVKDVNPFLNLK